MAKKNKYSLDSTIAFNDKKIAELITAKKWSLAKKLIHDSLELKPTDWGLKLKLALILIREGNLFEAKDILETLPMERAALKLTTVYVQLGMEEEQQRMYERYFRWADGFSYVYPRLYFYLKCRYEPNYKPVREELHYMYRQIYVYEKTDALEYIMDARGFNSIKKDEIFNENVDIEDLFYKATEYIKEHPEDGIPNREIYKEYVFFSPSCGINKKDNSSYDYFVVITMANSSDIVNMFPVKNSLEANKICNLSNIYDSQELVRSRSGLERFNAKYGKKV